jgi:hypothetical protein
MLPGISGSLLSAEFSETVLIANFAGQLGETSRAHVRRTLRPWWRAVSATLGPASHVRTVFDRVAVPLMTQLGFRLRTAAMQSDDLFTASMAAGPETCVGVVVSQWHQALDPLWRESVRHAIELDARWCIALNGTNVRVVDAHRTYARRFLDFELPLVLEDEASFAVFWAVMRPPGMDSSPDGDGESLLDRIVRLSDRHRVDVCSALQHGVRDAAAALTGCLLPRRARHGETLGSSFEQSLTVVYRIVFLLFAEARQLVPMWHPTYRDAYTVQALSDAIENAGTSRGLWEALQAISRLAHAGCHAGELVVTPFNGRLFAPQSAPLAERGRVEDEAMRLVLLSLTTRPGRDRAGRDRISYADLGVEQLGAVYEQVLDYEPVVTPGPVASPARRVMLAASGKGSRRKSTGTFYTPRALTDYLVRRTLQPLVDTASADAILSLRVLDPAMGSGAFLVAACHFLSAAYEAALIREGRAFTGDIVESDRINFRRTIAQRCLYGVDLNPMAVQVARLSMWLTTLAADRPLTFLDHRLKCGNSLIGASLDDVARQAPGGIRRKRSTMAPLLFDAEDLHGTLRSLLPSIERIAIDPGDTIASVREKERLLDLASGPRSPLARWKAVADLWCGWWFRDERSPSIPRTAFAPLMTRLLGGRSVLPAVLEREYLASTERIARDQRFFHWSLEFPEVYFDGHGRARADGGFDAVIGNPPWDLLHTGDGNGRMTRELARQFLAFVRVSGAFRAQSDGHANVYQFFAERAVALARSGGRIGMIFPTGLLMDRGSAGLRRMLFDRCRLDPIVGLVNRAGIFPIHRSMRFALVAATRGGRTNQLRCRFGLDDVDWLDTLPNGARDDPPEAFPVDISLPLLKRIGGEDLAVPDLRARHDVAILDRLTSSFPPLGSAAGWSASFGRELNATDDRTVLMPARARSPHQAHPTPTGHLPVAGGKQIQPFAADPASAPYRVRASDAARLLPARPFDRARLAYRDVAAPTNRLTLIAAIVPAGVVTTHTLFCLKGAWSEEDQAFLCGVFNSYVANYLVRMKVSTHVTVAIVEALPVPRPDRRSDAYRRIADLAIELLATRGASMRARIALQVEVARLYEFSAEDFEHVLTTFPLISEEERTLTLHAFREKPRISQIPG